MLAILGFLDQLLFWLLLGHNLHVLNMFLMWHERNLTQASKLLHSKHSLMFPTEKPIEVALLEMYFILLAKQPTKLKCLLFYLYFIFILSISISKCCESMQNKLSWVTVSPKKLQKSKGTTKISTICQSSWLGDWSYIEVGAVVYAWIYTAYTVKANVYLPEKSLIQ